MWLMLQDCFFSIVNKDNARGELLVRARRKGDIEKVFPHSNVERTPKADYLYRARVGTDMIVAALEGEVRRIVYSNFKASVKDDDLHDAYMKVWTAMASIQKPAPYSVGRMIGEMPSMLIQDDPFVPVRTKRGKFKLPKTKGKKS